MRFIFNWKYGVAVGLALFIGSASGSEPPLRLVSYTPDTVAVPTSGDDESGPYLAPVDELEAAAYADEPELLVFTCKNAGECPACDRARPHWEKLVDAYPITPIYCTLSHKPRTRGDVIARQYDVEAFPTFVLVVRNADGTADELDRWKGAGSFWEPLDKRIKRAFAESGFKPRIARGDGKQPKTAPRPIPGLNPPPRKEPPKPKPSRVSPPGVRPGRPRPSFGFTIDFDALELKD